MNIPFKRFAVLLPVFLLTGCTARQAAPAAPPEVSGLAAAQATMVSLPELTSAVGNVEAAESSVLSTQVSGRVTSVLVHEGDRVRAGQILLRLDDAQARAGVTQAEASLAGSQDAVDVAQTEADLASTTLARYQILRERKSVSPHEFDEVSRQAQASAAQLEAARSQLAAAAAAVSGARIVAGYSAVASPFAGIIMARHVDPGALATPGMALLEVGKAGPLRLHITVDESLLADLRPAMRIPVTIAALSASTMEGRVTEIVPAADPATHSFLVKIALPLSAGLHPGMYGAAQIGRGSRPVLVLPTAAVVTHGSLHSVWVLDENRIASLRYLSLGAVHGDAVEVLSGISPGETVVLAPADRELAGMRVQP